MQMYERQCDANHTALALQDHGQIRRGTVNDQTELTAQHCRREAGDTHTKEQQAQPHGARFPQTLPGPSGNWSWRDMACSSSSAEHFIDLAPIRSNPASDTDGFAQNDHCCFGVNLL